MARDKKNGTTMFILAFPFLVLGFVFLVSGNGGIGIPFLATGVVFIVAGAAGARKGASPVDPPGENPPRDQDRDRT